MAVRYISAPVTFEIEPVSALTFAVEKMRTVLFDFSDITIHPGSYVHYEGDYVITPRTHEQLMETKEKIMDANVTILQIPADYVGNEKGGKTATIG